jgi:hypothetical protein
MGLHATIFQCDACFTPRVGSLPATGRSICPSPATRKHHPQAGRLTTGCRSRLTQQRRGCRRTNGAGALGSSPRSCCPATARSSERSSKCSGRWAAVSVLRDVKPAWRRLRSSGKPPRHFAARPASRRLWGWRPPSTKSGSSLGRQQGLARSVGLTRANSLSLARRRCAKKAWEINRLGAPAAESAAYLEVPRVQRRPRRREGRQL